MLMILARLVRSESFWAVVKVRSPHNRPEVWYPRNALVGDGVLQGPAPLSANSTAPSVAHASLCA